MATMSIDDIRSHIIQLQFSDSNAIKRSLNAISKNILISNSNINIFLNNQGFEALENQIKVASGNTLSLVIHCLASLTSYISGIEHIMRNIDLLKIVYNHMNSPGQTVTIPTHSLAMFSNICHENANNSRIIAEIATEYAFARKLLPFSVIVDMISNDNVDLQTKALHFINVILTCCQSVDEYKKRFDLFAKLKVPSIVQKIEKDAKWDELSAEILIFHNVEDDFASSSTLDSQIKDITDLYVEQKNENIKLQIDLKFYKRREPLIHLLWSEIGKLRYHLNDAVSQGFLVSTDAPTERFNENAFSMEPIQYDQIDILSNYNFREQPPSMCLSTKESTQGDGNYRSVRNKGNSLQIVTDEEPSTSVQNQVYSPNHGYLSIPPPPAPSDDLPPPAPPLLIPNNNLPPPAPPLIDASLAEPSTATSDVPIPSTSSGPNLGPSIGGPPSGPTLGGPPIMGGPPMGPPGGLGGLFAAPAIEPTKPRINPGTKMKNIYWKRLLLQEVKNQLNKDGKDSNDNAPKSIWDTINSDPGAPKIDTRELEELFSSAASKLPESSPTAAVASPRGFPTVVSPKVPPKVRIIEDKRFNSMSIMLKRLPPVDEISKAFRTLDNSFDQDKLNVIVQAVPTTEEIQLVVDSGVSEQDLDAPERFILMCSTFPQVAARLECWQFKNLYEETHQDLFKPLKIISEAVSTLQNSKAMVKLLGLVLNIGNYLNGGTTRGQADGFDISILTQLDNTRDSGNKLNLVDYCVGQLIKSYGREFVERFVKDLSTCQEAARFCLKNIVSDIHKFAAETKSKKKMSTLVSVSNGPVDPFSKIMQAFNVTAELQSSKLVDQCDICHNSYMDMIRFFGKTKEYASRLTSDEFFSDINKFAQNVTNAVKKYEENEKKAAAAEKQKIAQEKIAVAKANTEAVKLKTIKDSK